MMNLVESNDTERAWASAAGYGSSAADWKATCEAGPTQAIPIGMEEEEHVPPTPEQVAENKAKHGWAG